MKASSPHCRVILFLGVILTALGACPAQAAPMLESMTGAASGRAASGAAAARTASAIKYDRLECLVNNCYNHATKLTHTFAVPGRASRYMLKRPLRRADVVKGATADGLVPVTQKEALADNENQYAALVLGPEDFHWYRKESNGLWSQKVGYKEPTENDFEGNIISDPSKAAQHPRYTDFGGYFRVPPTVNIQK